MKIENYQFPKSSFLSIEKDYAIIIDRMMKNDRLKKLLYFDTRDALIKKYDNKYDLEILEKNIKIVPKIYLDNTLKTYIVINFDNFEPNDENPEFRDNYVYFDIICHTEQWLLNDFQLRPYKIAGELDYMFDNKRLTGIGKLEFQGSQQVHINEDMVAISLVYRAVHGEEDKKGMNNPIDEEQFLEDFDNIYNS